MNNNEKDLRKSIGKNIKLARSRTDYTQEKLAEKLSLSTRYISQLERGIAFGSAKTIVNLCRALNISSDFLFEGLITDDAPHLNDFIDDKFLENYIKLNDYNKKVINSIVHELLKLQNSEKMSNKNIS